MRFAAVRMCLCFFMACLASKIAVGEVRTIRATSAYACHSREALQVVLRSLQPDSVLRNALLNGECILLHHGQEVHIQEQEQTFWEALRGDVRVRLPGDSRDWWMWDSAFLTSIEQERGIDELERAIGELEALTEQFERENRQRVKTPRPNEDAGHSPEPYDQVSAISSDQKWPSWRRISDDFPTNQATKKLLPENLFEKVKGSVWAVVVVKQSTTENAEPATQGSAR